MWIPVRGPPLARGEMRTVEHHTSAHMAVARCQACGATGWVSEVQLRVVARDPEACLICRQCGHRWHPIEGLPEDLRLARDLWVPRDGWI